ncbi:SDR family oxidoreductase [Paracrocinitomix mangrovi]|uniref:SDR family oxidoreductase n=1 Tax=Paracrocinitomix mangrovi TaxID=2862509 RepID=UPI001C8D03D5|nr:SDR family oxidoreductase [Paracrocinitomix mangrovi]UKN01788.1 SDR family oxidoreductase [Paracrocinitomix mangrovi]
MSEFLDKVVWVTGASSGIGAEVARQFSLSGSILVLSARNEDKLKDVQKSLKNPEKSFVLPLDLEKSENFAQKVDEVIAKYGRIDYLVNNGGVSQRGEAADTPIEVDRKIMEINYFGTVALTKAVIPVMRKQQSGHIIAISSIAGKFGFYWRSAYSAAKHAIQGFFESVLLEEAKNNIFVTIAYPGKINTPISLSAINAEGKAHGVMDHNQETGMPVDVCVKKLIKAISKKKKSVLIGNKEIKAVYIKRYFPSLFWKIIKKQKPV